MTASRRTSILKIIGPGIMAAATGVGAGDLATGAFSGNKLGLSVLWAVAVGALLKLTLNEGLARFQLATGMTLLEGAARHLGRQVIWGFSTYFLLWSFFVAAALMSACGVAFHAIIPLFAPETDKVVYGLIHSALAVLLVRVGGYALLERLMAACMGLMVLVMLATVIALQPPWLEVLQGLAVPSVPSHGAQGVQWTVGLMGGVGGTVTILSYGYWIRERGRRDLSALSVCRRDLGASYAVIALFGAAMVIIGSQTVIDGKGAQLVVNLADRLQAAMGRLGPLARWTFIVGAWAAVFSSLLGVWQSVPYLFSDLWRLARPNGQRAEPVDARSRAYRSYLIALALVPAVGMIFSFRTAQKIYAVFGALFMPLLALALLVLNNRRALVGTRSRNTWWVNGLLVFTLLFFLLAGWLGLTSR